MPRSLSPPGSPYVRTRTIRESSPEFDRRFRANLCTEKQAGDAHDVWDHSPTRSPEERRLPREALLLRDFEHESSPEFRSVPLGEAEHEWKTGICSDKQERDRANSHSREPFRARLNDCLPEKQLRKYREGSPTITSSPVNEITRRFSSSLCPEKKAEYQRNKRTFSGSPTRSRFCSGEEADRGCGSPAAEAKAANYRGEFLHGTSPTKVNQQWCGDVCGAKQAEDRAQRGLLGSLAKVAAAEMAKC